MTGLIISQCTPQEKEKTKLTENWEEKRMKRNEDESSRTERQALMKEIEARLRELDVEQLRRVDWYIDRIDR